MFCLVIYNLVGHSCCTCRSFFRLIYNADGNKSIFQEIVRNEKIPSLMNSTESVIPY